MTTRRQATAIALILALTAALAGHAAPSSAPPRLQAGVSEQGLPPYRPRLGRVHPVIAVIGDNEATEVTDYVVPYGILAESGVAEVIALSTGSGPIQMKPALRFRVQATISEFDARFPAGADYVVVPNIYEGSQNPMLLAWLRMQVRLGATIVGICDGVPVLANAGLLEGRRATAHWRTIDKLERRHPGTRWMRNRRFIADGNVITTSGVSASIPISVALVEAIGGRERAVEVAKTLGVNDWSPVHDSEQFRLGDKLVTALVNRAMFWRYEDLGVMAEPGVDEISLALTADSYSRTRRSWAFSVSRTASPVPTRRGLILLPDRVLGESRQPEIMLASTDGLPATQALDRALEGIEERYGERTAAFVAVQIEYPWKR
jgi:transcriptional regulator GlxA family with amidase domain